MICEDCGGKMRVMETRTVNKSMIVRRRKCIKCGKLMHTFEKPDKTGKARRAITIYRRVTDEYEDRKSN
jgi:transcriptional regulator NrdR family protein